MDLTKKFCGRGEPGTTSAGAPRHQRACRRPWRPHGVAPAGQQPSSPLACAALGELSRAPARAQPGVCVGIGLVTPLLSVQRCTTLLHTVALWQYVCAQRHAHWDATPQRCTGDAGRPGRPYLLADCPAHGVGYYGAVPPACGVDACYGGSAPLCHRRRRRDGCV
jgi:hypothetical protein